MDFNKNQNSDNGQILVFLFGLLQYRDMVTEKQVKEALKKVMDPELNVNVVDLGLVYEIKRRMKNEEWRINIVMTLTTPGCPLAGMFDALVRNALKKIPGLDVNRDVEIELTFDPPWTTEMMTDEVKAELGLD